MTTGGPETVEPTRRDAAGAPAWRRASDQIRSRFAIDNLGLAWIFLLIGTFSFTYRPATEVLSGQLTSSNLVRYACIVAALALIAPELRHRIVFRLTPIWLFAAYVVVCLLSALWSVSPTASLGKAAELAVATATILLAANRPASNPALDQLFKATFGFGALLLLVITIGYLLGLPDFWQPSRGVISRQMNTWFLSANYIGYTSALTATVALDRALGRTNGRALMWAIFCLAVTTLVLAQGRTGMLCFAIGVASVLLIRRKFVVLAAGAAVGLLVAIIFSEELLIYLTRGEPTGSLQTLTGRTNIWQGAWELFLQRPLTGNGFGVGGRYVFVTTLAGSGEDWSSVHNGVLELLTGVGLLGFAPWIVAVLWTIANGAITAFRGLLAAAPAIAFIMIVITLMSSGAAGWFDIVLAYFMCTAAVLSQSVLRAPATVLRRRNLTP